VPRIVRWTKPRDSVGQVTALSCYAIGSVRSSSENCVRRTSKAVRSTLQFPANHRRARQSAELHRFLLPSSEIIADILPSLWPNTLSVRLSSACFAAMLAPHSTSRRLTRRTLPQKQRDPNRCLSGALQPTRQNVNLASGWIRRGLSMPEEGNANLLRG
jgi:hypothetical protein